MWLLVMFMIHKKTLFGSLSSLLWFWLFFLQGKATSLQCHPSLRLCRMDSTQRPWQWTARHCIHSCPSTFTFNQMIWFSGQFSDAFSVVQLTVGHSGQTFYMCDSQQACSKAMSGLSLVPLLQCAPLTATLFASYESEYYSVCIPRVSQGTGKRSKFSWMLY